MLTSFIGERAMAETVRKVDYFYIETANKPGEGAKVLGCFGTQV